MIKVRLDLDSVAPCGARLTTFVVTFPRFILAELNTHRALSRNTASSRAIPVAKMVEMALTCPQVFESYGAANKGMSAQALMPAEDVEAFNRDWAQLAKISSAFAAEWGQKAAKQMVNRVLEPFLHVTAVVSATEWTNFFRLRAHPDAQPEFQALAYNMLHHYLRSKPTPVEAMGWHTPLLTCDEINEWDERTRVITSVARCARVSYVRHEQVKSMAEDFALYRRLQEAGHMSPFEHCARALRARQPFGNFIGWVQERKFLHHDSEQELGSGDLQAILDRKPEDIKIYE